MPASADELVRFRDTWLYEPEAFLVDEIVRLDPEADRIARCS